MVTRPELLRAGITDAEIKHRLSFGALFQEYRGVYRVGHRAPSVEARYLAAVRACGEGALLSGPAAGHLWGIVKGPAPPPHVTANGQRRVKGVRTKRARTVTPKGTTWRGIPITTVPQTLVDLAPTFSLDDLARACHEAGVRYGTTPAQVKELLRRQPGAAKLRAVMDGDAPVTLSRLEKRFLERLEEAGLPAPSPTAPPAPSASTAVGPSIGSRSSSTATPSTTPCTVGSRIGSGNGRRAEGATRSCASPKRT